MRRGLDYEKADAALKRAAHKAVHGTREERSGRFFFRDDQRKLDAGTSKPITTPERGKRDGR
jgi:hypothetical protein